MEDFAEHKQVRCPRCGSKPRFVHHTRAKRGSDHGQASYRCEACAHAFSIRIEHSELECFLMGADEPS